MVDKKLNWKKKHATKYLVPKAGATKRFLEKVAQTSNEKIALFDEEQRLARQNSRPKIVCGKESGVDSKKEVQVEPIDLKLKPGSTRRFWTRVAQRSSDAIAPYEEARRLALTAPPRVVR